jgi:hypothetical protein
MATYGGPRPETLRPIPEMSIQVMTTGKSPGATLALASALYDALFTTDGQGNVRPRNAWQIQPKKINSNAVDDDTSIEGWDVHWVSPIAPPGVVGRDEAGRFNIAFNFDTRFEAIEA